MKNKIIRNFFIIFTTLAPLSTNAGAIGDAYYALNSSLLSNLLAKEMCSCLFVTGAVKRFGRDEALNKF